MLKKKIGIVAITAFIYYTTQAIIRTLLNLHYQIILML